MKTKTQKRKYRIVKDASGMTPRQRLDARRAEEIELRLATQRGELVNRSHVEAGHAEMREVVRADLLGTLPMRLSATLSGKAKMKPQDVREAVLEAVREILESWAAGNIPVPDARAKK